MNSVCIVLVNFNGHNDTVECLESVLKSNHTNFQVVVVDNSDSERSLLQLESWAKGDPCAIQTKFPEFVFLNY